MTDRNDPSQYLTSATNADTYAGDSDMDDTQVQAGPDGGYATPEEMLDYVDPGHTPDTVTQFYTAVTGNVREIGVPRPIRGVTGYVLGGSGRIAGFSFLETSGNPGQGAQVIFHDGTDAGTPVVLTVGIAATQSKDAWYLPGGIQFKNGLFAEVTGTFSGVVYVATEVHE